MNDLIDAYKKHLGLNSADFSRIDHHDTMIAIVYKVTPSDKRPMILKICTRSEDYYRELFYLNSLKGILVIPKVLKTIAPAANLPGAILMEYIEGTLLQEKDWSHELAHKIGSQLAFLHLQRTPGYGNLANPHTLIPSPLNYFFEKFNEELEECTGHLPLERIELCKNYFNDHKHLLKAVDGPCMVHRDFRPGNMIVHQGKLAGIIDWASARSGFAEQDFCSMVHRNWPQSSEYKQSLFEGYSSIRPLPDFNRIIPLLRLGRALAVIGFSVKSDTWQGKNQKIYQYNLDFLNCFFS